MHLPTFLSRGDFADVYDLGDGTVGKVFRRLRHSNSPVLEWDDHDFITRRMFLTETSAYERLQDEVELVEFLPRYYGPIEVDSLMLPPSPSKQPFMPGCALRLELIPGTDEKVALIDPPMQSQIEGKLYQIKEVVGRVNVWDRSCFVPGSRAAFTIIDFAMWDDLSDAQSYLAEHGRIPESVRNLFSLGLPLPNTRWQAIYCVLASLALIVFACSLA